MDVDTLMTLAMLLQNRRIQRPRFVETVCCRSRFSPQGILPSTGEDLMNFEKRLEKAIVRGQQNRDLQAREKAEQAMSEEELKSLHSRCRLDLSDHIENCLKKLADHFPGFRFQTLVSDDGWGAKISRDDFNRKADSRSKNLYSRFEMLIRSFSSTHIVEMVAKGTIQNKEIISRAHYQFLNQVDVESFTELIDLWVLEYAEKFSEKM